MLGGCCFVWYGQLTENTPRKPRQFIGSGKALFRNNVVLFRHGSKTWKVSLTLLEIFNAPLVVIDRQMWDKIVERAYFPHIWCSENVVDADGKLESVKLILSHAHFCSFSLLPAHRRPT